MESRRRGAVAARLAPGRPPRRGPGRASPAYARRPPGGIAPVRAGGPPRVPDAARRPALAPALALSLLLHAAALAWLASRPHALEPEPIPIPIQWLEGVARDAGPGPASGVERPGHAAREAAAAEPVAELPSPPRARPSPARRPPPAPAQPRGPAVPVAPAEPSVPSPGAEAASPLATDGTGPAAASDTGVRGQGAGGGARAARDGGGPSAALPRVRHRPAPVYPLAARRRGHAGTSAIRLRIAADGRVIEARVHRSAGDDSLDAAAVSAVRRWRFDPASPGVDRSRQWFLVPIEFRLK